MYLFDSLNMYFKEDLLHVYLLGFFEFGCGVKVRENLSPASDALRIWETILFLVFVFVLCYIEVDCEGGHLFRFEVNYVKYSVIWIIILLWVWLANIGNCGMVKICIQIISNASNLWISLRTFASRALD